MPVHPVTVDEFRFGVAETYDVVVAPKDDKAYTIAAEPIDRTGFALATLAPREGMQGPVPEQRPRALLTMADMGMMHGDMNHDIPMEHGSTDHDMAGMDHAAMGHDMQGMSMEEMASGWAQALTLQAPCAGAAASTNSCRLAPSSRW